MGTYVQRNGKTYYKADDGKLYQNYDAASSASNSFSNPAKFVRNFASNLVNQTQQGISGAYKQADRSLGGWLPGGGAPNALTSGYDRPPESVAAIARSVGVSPDSFKFANLDNKRPLLNQIASTTGEKGVNKWGQQPYAFRDPFVGPVMGIPGSEINRNTVVHELGHLQGHQVPDLGRAIQTVSNFVPQFAPLKFLAGAMLNLDASNEDKAEQFRVKHLGNFSKDLSVHLDGTSSYGNSLRKEGADLRQEALQAVTQPFSNAFQSLRSSYRDLTQESKVKDWLDLERQSLESGTNQGARKAGLMQTQLLNNGYTQEELTDRITQDVKKRGPVQPFQ